MKNNTVDNSTIIEEVVIKINDKEHEKARDLIVDKYPFKQIIKKEKSKSFKTIVKLFFNDGFIDRYTGKKLINPGMLRVLSIMYPNEFPYHPNYKADECHSAFWDLTPSLDHVVPFSLGGEDDEANWVTTSNKNNSIKNVYSLEEIGWKLYPKGDLKEWDGLSEKFLEIVNENEKLLENTYVKKWYKVTKDILKSYL